MELWTEIRRRVLTKELSKRAACKEYDLGWWTLKKILAHDRAAWLSTKEAPTAAQAGGVPADHPADLAG